MEGWELVYSKWGMCLFSSGDCAHVVADCHKSSDNMNLYTSFRELLGNINWNKMWFSLFVSYYRGADKSLAQPDWKKRLKGRHFSSEAEVIAAAETWLDGQPSGLFLSGLQKLQFGRCNLFPSWSG